MYFIFNNLLIAALEKDCKDNIILEFESNCDKERSRQSVVSSSQLAVGSSQFAVRSSQAFKQIFPDVLSLNLTFSQLQDNY